MSWNPTSRKYERRRGLPDTMHSPLPGTPMRPSFSSVQGGCLGTASPADIHWAPPPFLGVAGKREEPTTPTEGHKGKKKMENPHLKARRLLPPSRRVDEGDDEIGLFHPMEVPPKVVRQHEMPPPPTPPMESEGRSSSLNWQEPMDPSAEKPSPMVERKMAPAVGVALSDIRQGDRLSPLESKVNGGYSGNFLYRAESVRSMASRSTMASHSTQAELDFYSRRHDQQPQPFSPPGVSNNKTSPPQWISSMTDNGSPSQASIFQQRRRMMLAKSNGMLRSQRPVWDRTESMRSFVSQLSHGSTLGGDFSLSGLSRGSSRKSGLSWNSVANTTRTPAPPDHVRVTTASSFRKPRKIIQQPAMGVLAAQARRPVQGMPSEAMATTNLGGNTGCAIPGKAVPAAAQSSTTMPQSMEIDDPLTTTAAAATKPMCMGTKTTSARSLLDDDDDGGDTWNSMLVNMAVIGAPPLLRSKKIVGNNILGTDDEADVRLPLQEPIGDFVPAPWHPNPGGSFNVYHRSH